MVGAAYKKDGQGQFSRVCSFKTRRNGFKIKEGGLDIRKKFFTLRVVKHKNRFHREAVDAPSPEMLMDNLDEALHN